MEKNGKRDKVEEQANTRFPRCEAYDQNVLNEDYVHRISQYSQINTSIT